VIEVANINIQMKNWNGTDWDSLFPKTKATLVEMNDATTVQAKIESILTDLSNVVTQTDIDSSINTAITNLVNGAPATLDTLNELAQALGDDPNFATTVTNALSNKVDKVTGKGLSTNDFTDALLNKLNTLPSSTELYTKTQIDGFLSNKVDKVAGKGLSTNDFTDAYETKLNELENVVVSPTTPATPTLNTVWFETL
jgi:hypothetical protein